MLGYQRSRYYGLDDDRTEVDYSVPVKTNKHTVINSCSRSACRSYGRQTVVSGIHPRSGERSYNKETPGRVLRRARK